MTDVVVGLDHVQIAAPAGCEGEARRFYGDALGLEELPKPPLLAGRGGVWFRAGAHELHVGVMDDFRAATKAHPAFRVRSVETLEELAARLVASRIEVTWAEPEEIPGTTRCHVADPWGNRVELVARAREGELA